MKIHTCKQGSAAWHDLRKGRITGTDVGEFATKPVSINLTVKEIQTELDKLGIEYKKSALKPELEALLPNGGSQWLELHTTARTLLIQKITDALPQDPWQIAMAEKEQRQFDRMPQIQRGKYLEPAARNFYALKTGHTVIEVGFIESDCGTFGFSPDGVILAEWVIADHLPDETFSIEPGPIFSGLEIKCPMPHTHRRWLYDHGLKGTVPTDHYWQVQMAMATTGAGQWDFLSFCPGEAPLLVTSYRSEVTEKLAIGLDTLANERDLMEGVFSQLWDAAYDKQPHLLCYPNGAPMFDNDGVQMLTPEGEKIIPAEVTV